MHGYDQFGEGDAAFDEQLANSVQIGSEPVKILVEQGFLESCLVRSRKSP